MLLPVWFPWALKPLLNHYGLDYAHYRRIGYLRFALDDVTGSWESASLKLKEVKGDLPAAWLWKKYTRTAKGPRVFILEDGDLTLIQSEVKKGNPAGSLDQILNDAMHVAGLLERVLPSAQLTNCSVLVASNLVQLSYADWRNGQLETALRLPPAHGEFAIAARVKDPVFLGLSVTSDEYDSSIHGELTKVSEGWHWEGKADWLTNQATITAQFSTNGWWPVKARVSCDDLEIPAKMLRRYGYENFTVEFLAEVSSNHFTLQASGSANPVEQSDGNGYPAAIFSLAANGNPEFVNLDELHIQSPSLNANLTNSVGITWKGELLAKPAQRQIAMDLSKLPGADLTGHVEGLVQVTPRGRRPPVAQFNFAASHVRLRQAEVENLVVRGKFISPNLQLDEIKAGTTDGSKFSASGSFDFRSQQIANGEWKFSGDILEKLFPHFSYDALTGSGQVEGPLTNLMHQGEVTLKGFHEQKLAPLDLHARWGGHNLCLDVLETRLAAGASMLALGGKVDFSALKGRKILATVTNLSLSRNDEELYVLQRPCSIVLNADGTNAALKKWSLTVDGFNWQGVNREVSLTANLAWPARGNITATMTNVTFRGFSDFLTNELPNASLDKLDLAAHWSNGPIYSTVSVSGSLTNRSEKPFVLRGELATGEKIFVKQLSVENDYTPALSITGNVPLMLVPGRAGGIFEWDKAKAIALAGTLVENGPQPFTLPIATYGTLTIQKPEFNFHLSGTLDEPSASVRVGVETMSWQPAATNLLNSQVEDFCLIFEVDRNRITLNTLSAALDGQPVRATGDWPLSTGDWRALWTGQKLPDWSKAEGRLQIEHLQMAAVARYLPQMLAPEGQMNATLELKSGRQFDGHLWLTNAATRPLGRISPLRDMAAEIRFDGRRATLQEFRGQISGQPVQATGFVDMGDRDGLKYQLNLNGTNVPVARSLGFLLRGGFLTLNFKGAAICRR